MTRLVALLLLLPVAACSSEATDPSQPEAAAPFDCRVLLGDARFDGLRLVEAMSNGSTQDLCFLAPANAATAEASVSKPVFGKRVVVNRADGSLAESGDFRFTTRPIDPGDDGPLVKSD